MVTPTSNRTDVLILGASGRVGRALSRLLPDHGLAVKGVSRKHASGTTGVDVCHREEVSACIEAIDPRVVVYAAAVSDPDRCEQDPSTSYDVNVIGADRVAATAAKIGCRLVYYSSDYVFGEPGRYFEDAPVSPLQVYGRHKSEAEQLVLSHGDNVVIRLPLLFGGRDFVAEAVSAAVQGTPLARDGRRRYPIPVEHVVAVTEMLVAATARPGIYHAVGTDEATKSEWACYIAGLLGKPVPPMAEPTKTSIARRPSDIELATHHPELSTQPGTLWTATRERVDELFREAGGRPTAGADSA